MDTTELNSSQHCIAASGGHFTPVEHSFCAASSNASTLAVIQILMLRNTSLIFTKEFSELYNQLVHFRFEEFYIIPVEADYKQFDLLKTNWDNYEPMDIAFEQVIKGVYNDDKFQPKPVYRDINDVESLLLIELLMRLKIKSFAIYHHSQVNGNEYRYWDEIVDGVLDYYSCENDEQPYDIFSKSPKFNFDDYMNFNYSKQRFLQNGSG